MTRLPVYWAIRNELLNAKSWRTAGLFVPKGGLDQEPRLWYMNGNRTQVEIFLQDQTVEQASTYVLVMGCPETLASLRAQYTDTYVAVNRTAYSILLKRQSGLKDTGSNK